MKNISTYFVPQSKKVYSLIKELDSERYRDAELRIPQPNVYNLFYVNCIKNDAFD